MRGRVDHAAEHRVPVLQRHRYSRAEPRSVHDDDGFAGRQTETVGRLVGSGGRLGRALRAELRGHATPPANAQKRRDAHENLAHAVRGGVRRRARVEIDPRLKLLLLLLYYYKLSSCDLYILLLLLLLIHFLLL